MIYSLCGKLIHSEPSFVVVECGGVGYKCLTTLNTQRLLPKIGERCTLYTHMLVRDDAIELCGFSGNEELNCFRLLMSVSGVGARLALALLSELRPEQIAVAVSGGDSKTLTRASGVGKKLAERIILELKDKLKLISTVSEESSAYAPASTAAQGSIQKAVGALAVLGYSPDEVLPFMSGIDPDLSTEEIIKQTLKRIGSA